MQRCQPVREPADGVALAAAGRMLNQIVMANAFALRLIDQRANRFELMVARKDQRLLLDLPALIVALFLDL
jgi:hypothetical protein